MIKPTILLRFADLQARRIVRNREQLRNLIRDHRFPSGFLLSPNARAWDEQEVEAWLTARREATSDVTREIAPNTQKRSAKEAAHG